METNANQIKFLTDEDLKYYREKVILRDDSSYTIDSGCYYFEREGFYPVRVTPAGTGYDIEVVPYVGY